MKHNFIKNLIFFLFINFGGLAIGSFLMNNGPTSEWYLNLNKAPWTPKGWGFGVAWTTIMICFSIFLAKLFLQQNNNTQKIIFGFQFLFNVSWNYAFFNQHQTFIALIIIALLTSFVFYYFFTIGKSVKNYRYLMLPYLLWLCIAISLNLYVVIHN